MSLVKVRRASQITLPVEVRTALGIEEGDYLETSIVEGGVLLKPVTVIDKSEAWRRLESLLGADRSAGAGRSEDEVMEMAVSAIKEIRKGRREGPI